MTQDEVQQIRDQAASVADLMADEAKEEMHRKGYEAVEPEVVVLLLREVARLIRAGLQRRGETAPAEGSAAE